jgi:hypothetical protein
MNYEKKENDRCLYKWDVQFNFEILYFFLCKSYLSVYNIFFKTLKQTVKGQVDMYKKHMYIFEYFLKD